MFFFFFIPGSPNNNKSNQHCKVNVYKYTSSIIILVCCKVALHWHGWPVNAWGANPSFSKFFFFFLLQYFNTLLPPCVTFPTENSWWLSWPHWHVWYSEAISPPKLHLKNRIMMALFVSLSHSPCAPWGNYNDCHCQKTFQFGIPPLGAGRFPLQKFVSLQVPPPTGWY